MTSSQLRWPSTAGVSLLAGLTVWISLWAWAGLVEEASGYLVPALTICFIVAVSGMLMRSARVHTLLIPFGQLALLLLWLNRTWAADVSLGGWIPTPESLRELTSRLAEGTAAAQAYAAPVPETVPVIHALFIVAAIGTAVLVDFIACGLRRVPLAGLPLLAVYTVPVSIVDGGVAWWVFAAGALSFLSVMAADEAQRLAHWGRQVSDSNRVFDTLGTTVSTQAVRSSARKIGLTATGLAVVVPIFIPTLTTGFFGGGSGGLGGDGDAVSISNPMVDLKRDLTRGRDVDLVWLATADPDPSYLRISALDSFDGETWKPSGRDIPVEQRANGRLPRPPGLESEVTREEFGYDVQIGSEFSSRWLPAPYPTSFITTRGDWRYDVGTLDFISAADGQTTENYDYSLRALDVRPTAGQLASAGAASEAVVTPYTALPASMPESLRQQARSITNERTSRFEKAVLLQQWFREDGGFTYSTARDPGNGLDDLEQFLGDGPDSRTGYCEQFAAAMALMGRSIGIPSRVAIGFLRPSPVGDDTFVYSAHDLHAWPEMYFAGVGWVRFEPTPQGRAAAVPGYTRQTVPTDGPSAPPSSEGVDAGDNRIERRPDAGAAAGSDGDGGSGAVLRRSLGAAGLVLALALVGCAPRAVRTVVRRRRLTGATSPAGTAEAAWSELRDTALDLRLPWDDSVTLRTRARSLVQSFGESDARRTPDEDRPRLALTGQDVNPEAAEALQRLVKYVERARYSRSMPSEQTVLDDLALCVSALENGVSRRRRMLGTWLPASLTANLNRTLLGRQHAADGPTQSDLGVDHAV